METQYITDKKGKKIGVILSMKDYKEMLDKIDLIEDVKLYDKSKKDSEESVAAVDAFKYIENQH